VYLFQEMCASIGVDPLASSKGFWSEMLGFGDFYYELAVQVGLERHSATG
jgi:ESCRT-II complex subunit VPS22